MKVRDKVSVYLATALLILGGMLQLPLRRAEAFANTVGGGANGASVQASITGLLPINIVSVAAVTLPPGGGNVTNGVLTVPLNPVLSTGVIINQATGQTGFPTTATSTSTVDGLNVLGLVTATTVRSQANSTCNGVTASSNGNGSTVENLSVLGATVPVQPAPNTNFAVVNVPVNVGSLTGVLVNGNIRLNEQFPTGDGINTSGLTVNQIHVTLTGTLTVLGVPVEVLSADVIVAQATSSVSCMPNSNPTITPAPSPPNPVGGTITRQQGSPASSATIASVSDPNEPAGNLTVTAAPPPGITVANIVNNNGTVTADVAAASDATLGPIIVVLTVTDSNGESSTANLTVNVTANTPPTLGDYPNTSINVGAGTIVTPNAAPSDNGTVVSLTASAPGFTGTLTGNPATGVMTVGNAGPVGVYTVTVTATDNGGATSTKTFQLTVNNDGPTIAANGSGAAAQQGGPTTVGATIASVSDPNEPAGNLTVTAAPPPGITLTNIVNTNGTVTADVAAACNATPGSNVVVLTVTDGNGGSSTANLTVNVTANTAPSLGDYPNASVNFGAGTTVTPSAAPGDNGTVASLTASAPGFTGTLTGEAATGVITVASAGPVGIFTVTVTATDNCGTTATRTFQLTVNNSSPTITAAPSPPNATAGTITRQQGSPASSATIASVNDPNEPAGNLTVTASAPPGIIITNIVNNNGTVTADVAAANNATLGPNVVVLTVTDGNGGSSTANLTVNVTANTPPTLGDYPNTSVNTGAGTIVTPSAPPSDNGTVVSLTASAPGFTGTLTGDPATGVITVGNAGPVGVFTVTVTATDDGGATATRTFQLTVNNDGPTIAANGSGAPAQQGGPTMVGATIATVSDPNEPAGNLTVTAAPPPGITVANIVNNNGTVTADVTAACTATPGANVVVLTVTDGNGGSSTANLTVNVTANTAPSLGSYANTSMVPGGSTVVVPSAAPADSGSITSITVSISPNTFTGSLLVNQVTGEVSINNANPTGVYTVTVTATDNCGATTAGTFQLTVNLCPTVTIGGGASQTIVVGQTVNIPISATDPDGGTVSLVVANLPANATFAPNPATGTPMATGTLTFTPTVAQANQIFTINVVARDNNDCSATAAGAVEVILTVLPNQEICPQAISPGGECFTADLNSGSFTVTGGGTCNWTATTDTPWITITGGASGTGNGMITYTVEQNLNQAPRSGTITINNQTFTVLQGRYFDDVPPEDPFYTVIHKIAAKRLTVGCTTSSFCPLTPTTRGQMVAFIIREIVGFTPVPTTTQTFADVAPGYPFYEYIETAHSLGIIEAAGVNGQGQPIFMPNAPIIRENTVTWLVRSLGEFNPPTPSQPRFADVPPSHPYYAFIERAAELGITVGCGVNAEGQPIFCPTSETVRSQMAAFLIRTYGCP